MLQTAKNKIQRGFSASARHYDVHASLHREIADDLLIQVINGPAPSALLDVGCGTGYLTAKLKDYFPLSKIIGLDFAQGMLEVARSNHGGIEWVLGNCHHLPFPDSYFDILVSNLAYQWAEDLAKAFTEAKRVLLPDGVLACTLFGYNTCQELFYVLNEAKSGELRFHRLPDESKIREALSISGFKEFQVEGKQIKTEFKDMHELTGWLKTIGANHLSREGFIGPETMSRAASHYQDKFSYQQGIGATFEVIRVYAPK